MYYYLDVQAPLQATPQRHIFARLPDGGVMSFPLTPDNPNTAAYEAWLAEGNTPEEWNPDATQ
jgi:hypothetical protein